MSMVREKTKSEEISQGDIPQKFMGFQLTKEGKPCLSTLIKKLRGNYAFFSEMDDREIVSILKLCGRRSYEPGQTIFEQGDTGNCFYMIIFGNVSIVRKETELSRLKQGQCFGEMAVLEEQPRNATARAIRPTLLFSLERDTLVDTFPSLGFKVASHLAKELSKKLRDMDEQADN
ncbi:MAG: cyclic nucleotide-binding domain-containing protein [Nitrospinaceae bacterium]|jgi:eukaryotic-like serine/threonine-protein kinase|nr:cyclic nucleotide-binding domain-containing protein [Nitrospinaceae bacterium]MBT3433873.1 cyclic nucleotide-binding domain-containing protein [Nitrospinaceae bacterium]MBT3820464.1 cyclic nucleotide-binding domain-containing protein [Nitrospinaceae bacterium]MBT4095425.1 cyclic nucleotide-binding domain-containing protein [Nitrospinaceae bacterium]MBT4429014.1 cyclic nucleotide-binding domain-containing protein [Nitrospinaceae bacterium]